MKPFQPPSTAVGMALRSGHTQLRAGRKARGLSEVGWVFGKGRGLEGVKGRSLFQLSGSSVSPFKLTKE